jgi:outer membrane biosynthesis protein TonB
MKKTHNTIQTKLSALQMRPLKPKEADLVWEHIRFNMNRTTPHARKTRFSILKRSVAITLIFGLTTGTALAADNAKPGDMLFPVDRAIENVQLSLASENNKDALKVKFALERVTEVKDILKEVSVQQTETSIKIAAIPEEEPPIEEPTVDQEPVQVAQEPTQQKVAISKPVTPPEEVDQKETEEAVDATPTTDTTEAETPSKEIPEVAQTNASGTPAATKVAAASSSKALVALQKDISDTDKKRIELALGTALSFLGDVKGELSEQGNTDAVAYIDVMLAQINKDIGTLPGEVTFEVHVSAKKERVSFEVTSQDNKPTVNIEVKDDEPATEPEETDLVDDITVTETPKSKPAPTESKLEIKDGEIKITKTSPETEVELTESDTPTQEQATNDQTEDTEDTQAEEDTTAAATSSEDDLLDDGSVSATDDGTTSVKVIFKKLNEDFEFTVTDQNASLHDIIEDYTDKDSADAD